MEVAAYYFPSFHPDPRNEAWHGPGWTEWELLKHAEPRFPGHLPPGPPLWGYEDEADPTVMSRKIDVAAAHGITAFFFDWYWYSGRPFLQRALEQGFMAANRAGRLRFAIMWANHDWMNLFPWKRASTATILEAGAVDAVGFIEATDYAMERYFTDPHYLRIDGCPFFSIYDLDQLVRGMGSLTAAADVLDELRGRARAAGFPGIHLNVIRRERPVWSTDSTDIDFDAALAHMDFDSITSYSWLHHHPLPQLQTPYAELADEAESGWHRFAQRFRLPYLPNVTVGWDPSPRTVVTDTYDPSVGYPHTNVVVGNTPELFGQALRRAQRFVHETAVHPAIVTINAWNEWTEGSHLEPGERDGLGYLEQIREVFGVADSAAEGG